MGDDWKKPTEKVIGATSGLIKGNMAYSQHTGQNYKVMADTSPNCKVNVIDKTAGRNGDWVFRLDKAHGEPHNYNHVNINPRISGLPHDPHLPLPPGGLTAGKGVAKVFKAVNKANKLAVPLAVVLDTVEIGTSVHEDYENGTTRNTVESVASVAGGWGGGFGGAVGGAAVGTAILPGIGTIAGGIIGGVGGGIVGALGASAVVEAIGEAVDYDVEEMPCKKCGRKFKVRKYRGETNRLCPECASLQ